MLMGKLGLCGYWILDRTRTSHDSRCTTMTYFEKHNIESQMHRMRLRYLLTILGVEHSNKQCNTFRHLLPLYSFNSNRLIVVSSTYHLSLCECHIFRFFHFYKVVFNCVNQKREWKVKQWTKCLAQIWTIYNNRQRFVSFWHVTFLFFLHMFVIAKSMYERTNNSKITKNHYVQTLPIFSETSVNEWKQHTRTELNGKLKNRNENKREKI